MPRIGLIEPIDGVKMENRRCYARAVCDSDRFINTNSIIASSCVQISTKITTIEPAIKTKKTELIWLGT